MIWFLYHNESKGVRISQWVAKRRIVISYAFDELWYIESGHPSVVVLLLSSTLFIHSRKHLFLQQNTISARIFATFLWKWPHEISTVTGACIWIIHVILLRHTNLRVEDHTKNVEGEDVDSRSRKQFLNRIGTDFVSVYMMDTLSKVLCESIVD